LPPDPALTRAAVALARRLPHFPDPFTLPSEASNAWAVDAAHSTTGAPLLAGDPHLGFAMPGTWYLARIETPEGVLAGATSPGVPFMVLGHNGHVAWSFTTTGADTEDLFVETPLGTDTYQTPQGPRRFETRQEVIHVRGGADVALAVRETRHGPVVSDALWPDRASPVLALAATMLVPHDTAATGLLALNHARSVADAVTAAALITSPVQNLVVADRDHIALVVTGRVPLRRAGDGRWPVDGGDGAHDWVGLAGGEAMPRFLDPASGHVLNANEPVVDAHFPVFLGADQFPDDRARRIRALLTAKPQLSLDDFLGMQQDVTSAYAQKLLPVLLAAQPETALGRAMLAALRGWDGSMRAEAPQPLIFNAWLTGAYAEIASRNQIPAGAPVQREAFMAAVLTGSPAASPGGMGAAFCRGDCGALLARVLDQTGARLAARYGADPARWQWRQAHRAVFAHPVLGRIPGLDLLGAIAIPFGGDNTTIDLGGGIDAEGNAFHGPSFRGVYDLADLSRSRFVVAPGQSGNLLSPHARDFLARWRDGETVSLTPSSGPDAAETRLLP
jgi:penicillin amidase